jgi:hypothetical protein
MPTTAALPRPPAPAAIPGELPTAQAPQLCQLVASPPETADWLLFAVFPASNGNWMIDSIPSEPGSFAPRLQRPEAWAGLQSAELADQTDAVFVHLRRFVGAARSREGAVTMARRALEMGQNDLAVDQSVITTV